MKVQTLRGKDVLAGAMIGDLVGDSVKRTDFSGQLAAANELKLPNIGVRYLALTEGETRNITELDEDDVHRVRAGLVKAKLGVLETASYIGLVDPDPLGDGKLGAYPGNRRASESRQLMSLSAYQSVAIRPAVHRAMILYERFGCPLRVFTPLVPEGKNREEYIPFAEAMLKAIGEECAAKELPFVVETFFKCVGATAAQLVKLFEDVPGNPGIEFDPGNVFRYLGNTDAVIKDFEAGKSAGRIAALHIQSLSAADGFEAGWIGSPITSALPGEGETGDRQIVESFLEIVDDTPEGKRPPFISLEPNLLGPCGELSTFTGSERAADAVEAGFGLLRDAGCSIEMEETKEEEAVGQLA